MVRNFDDILAQVLEQIPEGETRQLIAAEGKKVSTSMGYAPPEDQAIHWLRFANALLGSFPVRDTPWKEKIHEIMVGSELSVELVTPEELTPSTLEEYEKHEGCPSDCTPNTVATVMRAIRAWQAQTKLPETDREFRVFRDAAGEFVIEHRFEFDLFKELVFEKEPDPVEFREGWEEVPVADALARDGKLHGIPKVYVDATIERVFHFVSQCRDTVAVPKDWKLLCAAKDADGELHFAVNEILADWAAFMGVSLWGTR